MQETESRFVDEALVFWRRRATRPLSSNDIREITENISGFFQILMEWDSATDKSSTEVRKSIVSQRSRSKAKKA
jgi:hypothetical protein